MTDPSRIQTQWKTPFFFSPHEKRSSDDMQQYFTTSHATDTSSSARSSPLHSPLPHFPASPYHHHLRQPNSCASFQPFDPFDTDSALDDSTANKDAELDKLRALLSRQFLEDVDAETVPSSSSPTITKATCSTMSTPNARMLGSFTHTMSSPWTINDGTSFKQPWSPAISTSGLLPSPTLTAMTTTTTTATPAAAVATPAAKDNNTPITAAQWGRFEPYGNDYEFDPTLPFYQGNSHPSPININPVGITTATTTTTISNHDSGQENQQQTFSMTTLALQKLSLLFPGHSEKELEQTLAALDYDVERTIEALSPNNKSVVASASTAAQSDLPPPVPVFTATSISKAPLTSTAEKVHLIRTPSIAAATSTNNCITTTHKEQQHHQALTVSTGTVRKRQVCRHYLAGECYRKDCWFAHDLEVKPCKFWLQGLCLKGDTCEFAHSLEELEQVAKNHHHHRPSSPSNNDSSIDDKSTSAYHHRQQEHQQQQDQEHSQPSQYTSPTVADFPILLARSKRKSKKKSHNKKIKT